VQRGTGHCGRHGGDELSDRLAVAEIFSNLNHSMISIPSEPEMSHVSPDDATCGCSPRSHLSAPAIRSDSGIHLAGCSIRILSDFLSTEQSLQLCNAA